MLSRAALLTCLIAATVTGCGGDSSASKSPSSAPPSPSPSGHAVTSQEWHFSASFPEEPEQNPINVSIGNNSVQGRVFSVGTDDDGSSVTILQFPTGVQVDPDHVVQASIRGAATNSNGRITSQRSETFQGHPAQVATIAGAKATVTLEAFVADNREYAIVGAPQDAFDQLRTSFKLLP